MPLPDVLLDILWSIQFIPGTGTRQSGSALTTNSLDRTESTKQVQSPSNDCYQYLLSRRRAEPQDDLNDASERTGQLRECSVTQLLPHVLGHDSITGNQSLGLLIETRFQKVTYPVILLNQPNAAIGRDILTTLLYKSNQNHIKHVKHWLDSAFSIPLAEPLQLPSELLLQMLSAYLTIISSSWLPTTSHTDALRQATLKQVIGSLKLTLSFTAGSEIVSKLRTVDLDVPAETVNILLEKAKQTATLPGHTEEDNFLVELGRNLHQKTGLKLPLTSTLPLHTTDTNAGYSADGQTEPSLIEPPLRVTKISCAAFAISVEGRIKFASKPIENAEAIGYDEAVVRKAHQRLLDMVRHEAQRRSVEDER